MKYQNANEMKWKICPARTYRKKAVLGWLVILICFLLTITTNVILGICLTAILIATQANFLFSSTFTLNESGITAKYPLRTKKYSWVQVKRVKFFKDACYMFTRKKPSNLDGWSGMAVFYLEKRDKYVPVIKQHLGKDVLL